MKLARFRSERDPSVRVGLVSADHVTPVGPGGGLEGQRALLAIAMARPDAPSAVGDAEPIEHVTMLTPVPEPPSIRDFYAFEAHVAAGRRSRGLEMEPEWYELPVFYFSNTASILGPDDPVRAPTGTVELDYELEVAAVIGRECADVDPSRWVDVVAGFTIMDDWSARDLQRREMALNLGPAKGKDFGTSLGPVLVTPDELLADDGVPRAAMEARVNGEAWSRGELGDLHHGWGTLIAHASQDTRLRPGDVIGSGTVGTGCILELGLVHGRDRYPYLSSGDEVELEVAGIGVLRNRVV
ncbi:MAG TPA: fumarylacetoacetate hydrolase family protein [Ornithinibacter sp.]|nr:fumarylacetoacetate hydrolase family protein [Ornithinibacter sp.]